MTQSTTAASPQPRSSFFDLRAALTTGFVAASLLAATFAAHAQEAATPAPDAAAQTTATPTAAPDAAPPAAQPADDITLSNRTASKARKLRKEKEDKVVQSKETRTAEKRLKKDNALAGIDPKLPDKELYDKAEDSIKRGRFDVGRLDLQTLLNTYPDSQFIMRAKLAIADSWYKEGGTAALTQANQEYKDFITFFPNSPEAAEAQMRVGDIYFREMDKPDRDYTTTTHAEEEYRLMLQQFPDSPLVPQAEQHLREVQEVMASRETHIADFYAQRQPPNYSGAIARYQTVVDSYPLYSHMDVVLISLGDAYEAEAKAMRTIKATPGSPEKYKAQIEAGKSRMIRIYEDQAAAAYRKVVLDHSAASHVDDAKDRLVGMGLPVPVPTAEQVAASTALENSRGQYTLSKRAIGLFMNSADTVPAATIGTPPLEDPPPVSAATIARKSVSDFSAAMNPGAVKAPAPETAAATDTPADATPDSAAPAPAAPLALEDVPTATASEMPSSAATSVSTASPTTPSSSGTSMGLEIVRPGDAQGPVTAPATPPAFPGTKPAVSAGYTGGIQPVGPDNATALAPIEKAAPAPEVINEAAGVKTPPAQTATPGSKKKPKPEFDKSTESSSKHKKKKGLAKIDPL
jgi:outer membrane protein assembly factor BamD